MKQVRFILIISLLLLSNTIMAINIKGTVNSTNGKAIKGVIVNIKNTNKTTQTNTAGKYYIQAEKNDILIFSLKNYLSKEVKVNSKSEINVVLVKDLYIADELIIEEEEVEEEEELGLTNYMDTKNIMHVKSQRGISRMMCGTTAQNFMINPNFNTEEYSTIHENGFKNTFSSPVSTVSVDVDAASYSNMRRYIMQASKPPKDAIRIEEMINYFGYQYKEPTGETPFSINNELAVCPWNKKHQLLQIALQGKHIKIADIPASNMVFLIDVSGSMSNSNKLPLLKKAFKLLVNKLRKQDRVAIVVYAGNSGLVLKSTSGNNKKIIIEALEKLNAGGSTAGGEGIKLAYKVAHKNFIKNGNNRIILATDGDFNIGESSNAAMERLIEKEKDNGVFMSVLGFGMGNYKDSKMEIIADKGNGNYAYIDNILEAKKVLINEFGSTLYTIAKDVKIQIEFNPAQVKEYRLIGYENRILNTEDFDNDKKDAGEIGAGHNVTFLYEIITNNSNNTNTKPLKYQTQSIDYSGIKGEQLATVKFRYKKPTENKSLLIEKIISSKVNKNISENLKFASAVASFGMMLRDSEYKADSSYEMIIKLAKQAKGKDENGYRSEFIQIVELSKELK